MLEVALCNRNQIGKLRYQSSLQHCGTLGLCWSRYRIRVELKALNVKVKSSQVQRVKNFIKRQSCQLVFDCLRDNVCTFFEGYFTKIEHNINTRNNRGSKLSKAKLEFGRRSFAFKGALVLQYFNSAFKTFKF